MTGPRLILILASLAFLIFYPGSSPAVTVTASPAPAYVNQSVSISSTADFVFGNYPSCQIIINFGDGSPDFMKTCIPPPPVGFPGGTCTAQTSHVYTRPGTFTISALGGVCGSVSGTNPATMQITVLQCTPLLITSPSTLPSSRLQQPYTYRILSSGGYAPVSYSVASGALPPGLSLSPTGLLSGTPTSIGIYSFTVDATDSCPGINQTVQKTFTIHITQVLLRAVPNSFAIPRGQSTAVTANYQFSGDPQFNMKMNSSDGRFIVSGETVETKMVPLTANILGGSGSFPEAINIPVRVIEIALKRQTNRFVYERTFSGDGITLNASINFTITTEAGADFDLKRVELYFENRRSEITVQRNYPLRAYADIRFVGSGLLEGFWETDGRALSHVSRHLNLGAGVTLETPETTPLPTFATGTHRVRFVVTRPALEMQEPEAIYFVTETEYKGLAEIRLLAPGDDAEIKYEDGRFQWEMLREALFFLVEYFESPDAAPVFSAHTKENFYILPEVIHKDVLPAGRKYYWRVTAFDSDGITVGKSNLWSFFRGK